MSCDVSIHIVHIHILCFVMLFLALFASVQSISIPSLSVVPSRQSPFSAHIVASSSRLCVSASERTNVHLCRVLRVTIPHPTFAVCHSCVHMHMHCMASRFTWILHSFQCLVILSPVQFVFIDSLFEPA